MTIRLGVIGAGHMGKLHCRVLSEMPEVRLACVADIKPQAARAAAEAYGAEALTSAEQVIGKVDAAIVAVPTVAHVDVARPLVAAGVPVLIEKPLADRSGPAAELIELARRTKASVQVGHTERFNPAVEAIRRFEITPKFIEAHRISPFTFRSADIGVVLDMMIHDIDLVLMMVGCEPVEVRAVGVNVLGAPEDIANARLQFPNGCVANLTASRLAIKSERKMRIFSEQAYLSVDYGRRLGLVAKKSENLDLLRVFRDRNAEDLADLAGKVDYTRMIKVEQLQVEDSVEPLRKQADAFVRCVAGQAQPVVTAEEGLAAVRCAEAVTQAIRTHRWDGRESDRTGLDILG